MTVKASTGEIYLRWIPRKKRLELLTEDNRTHQLTVEDALGLFMGIVKLIPKAEAMEILQR